jgi:uncharacterized protein YjhX (UPF0386 family)
MNIPAALTARPAWVVWKYENGTKVPYSAKTGHKASSTKESTWTTFDVAFKVAQGRGFDGVGFVFSEDDPFTGIDLDDCRDDAGGIADWAMEIVTSLESYTEVSPSGHGLKIWVEGSVPTAVKQPYETGKIEIYSTARYFTVTGQHLEGTPSGIRNANGALTALYEKLKPSKMEPQFRPAPSNRDERAEAWARKKLAKAIEMVTLSVDGHKDDTLLAAARLAAGALPHISEWEIETALFSAIAGRATDSEHARKTIRNGIKYGENAPLALPPPPPQPVFDEYGRACCPVHRTPLPKANNGNGYKCRQRDPSTPTGWCAFWWSGEGYIEPKANELATSDHGNAAAPDRSSDALLVRSDVGAPLFRLYRMDDLRQLPPVQWLIPHEVPAGLLTVLCGPSEAGKSFIALDYAISVARAKPDRMVVYVAPEGGSGYRARVDAWVSHHGGEAPENLVFVLRDVPMLDAVSVHVFISEIKQNNPVLVILDTLARCMVGGDENSAEDMGLFIHSCDLIRAATSAAVIIVHHTGKSGGYRGSSVLFGSCDSWIDVSNDDGLITVSCGKAKDWQRFDPRYLRMAPKDESVVLMPAEQVSRGSGLTDGQRKVLEVLALDVFREAGAKSAQIKSAADQMPDKTLFRVLSHLKRGGFVNQGRRGDPYTITFRGLEEIKAYHRALRDSRLSDSAGASNAQLSSTVTSLSSTPDTSVMSTVTTVTTPPIGGSDSQCDSGSSRTSATTDDLFPDEDDPLLPLPANKRMTTRMMLRNDAPGNLELARQRCEEYGIDFEEARAWARGHS